MAGVVQDLRYALRQFYRNPGFTIVVVVSLALGIGANTAIFSLIDAVMLRSLPVRHPQRLVILRWTALRDPMTSGSYFWSGCPEFTSQSAAKVPVGCTFSYPTFEQVSSRRDVFADVSAFAGPVRIHLTANHLVSMATSELVSGSFFSTLGVHPVLGRTLDAVDDTPGAPRAIMLSYGYWQNRFGGDPSIVGKSLLLENAPFNIIGVASARFSSIDPGLPVDIWAPLSAAEGLAPQLPKRLASKSLWISIIARLRADVPMAEAQAATSVVFASGASKGPDAIFKPSDAPRVELLNGARGLVSLRSEFSRPLFLLMVLVGIILLIACANVGGLLLVRATGREMEMTMRFSLGGTRARISRQLLTESLLLAMMGAALGIVIAYLSANLLAAFFAANWYLPVHLDVRPDGTVLGFTLGVAVLTSVLFGLAPTIWGMKSGLVASSKGGGETLRRLSNPRFRLGNVLVVAQVALSVVILAGTGLLVRTLFNLERLNVGFETKNILLFNLDTTLTGYKGDQATNIYRELQDQLATFPGVLSTSYSMVPLLSGGGMDTEFASPGIPDKKIRSDVLPVGPRFFETMRIPLLAGRPLLPTDFARSSKPEPVVINESLAKKLFGMDNPLGRQFNEGETSRIIVGIVRDTKYTSLRVNFRPTAYIPLNQDGGAEFEIRTAGNPRALASVVRQAANSLNANLLVSDMKTQSEQINQLLYQERLVATLSSAFGVLALSLACMGIYGLVSYEATRRTREIGIRIALGALPRQIRNLVAKRGLMLGFVGAAIGVVTAVWLTQYLQKALYNVRSADPWIFGLLVVLVAIVVLLASYIPTYRATNNDAMVVLRHE